jgi:hypothetical protein
MSQKSISLVVGAVGVLFLLLSLGSIFEIARLDYYISDHTTAFFLAGVGLFALAAVMLFASQRGEKH